MVCAEHFHVMEPGSYELFSPGTIDLSNLHLKNAAPIASRQRIGNQSESISIQASSNSNGYSYSCYQFDIGALELNATEGNMAIWQGCIMITLGFLSLVVDP